MFLIAKELSLTSVVRSFSLLKARACFRRPSCLWFLAPSNFSYERAPFIFVCTHLSPEQSFSVLLLNMLWVCFCSFDFKTKTRPLNPVRKIIETKHKKTFSSSTFFRRRRHPRISARNSRTIQLARKIDCHNLIELPRKIIGQNKQRTV